MFDNIVQASAPTPLLLNSVFTALGQIRSLPLIRPSGEGEVTSTAALIGLQFPKRFVFPRVEVMMFPRVVYTP
jgi:hypothetical protein